jgi:hypothetical protein
MVRRSLVVVTLAVLASPACASRKEEATAALTDAAPANVASLTAAETRLDARPEAAIEAAVAARPAPKTYKTVVHMGDSMVGGGLCKALAPKFKAEGTRFIRDVWESASIPAFAESDRVQMLMKRWNPDLVLVTLGANDVFNDHPEYMVKHIERIVKNVGKRDCVWIGPPLWKEDKGLVDVLREHVAPCRFYDSEHLVLQRAGDGIHPTEKGGEVWANAFWPFFKGEADSGML